MPSTSVVAIDRSPGRAMATPTPTAPTATPAAVVPSATDGTTQNVQLSVAAGPFTTAVARGAELVVLAPSAGAATGTLPRLTVVNALGDGAAWASRGRVSDFHGLSGDPCPAADCIDGGQLGWSPAAAVVSDGSAQVQTGPPVAPGSSVLGGVGAMLCSVPQGGGGGTFACDALLALAVPPSAAPGDYTAVLSLATADGAVATRADVVLTTRVGNVALPVVPQGGVIDFAGGGFGPGTTVTITLHSTPIVLATTTADASGRFAVSITVPADTPTGLHRLVATGVGPDGLPHAVVMTIEVVPVGTVVPPPGPPITTPPTTVAPEVLGSQELPAAARGSVTPVTDGSAAPTGPTTTAPGSVGPDERADGPGAVGGDSGSSGAGSTAWWLVVAAVVAGGLAVIAVLRRRRTAA